MPERGCSKGSYITELRRSHAAGVHNTAKTRTELNRRAVNMSMLDEDWPNAEPTEVQLMAIELDDELDEDLMPDNEDLYPLVTYPGELDDVEWDTDEDDDVEW